MPLSEQAKVYLAILRDMGAAGISLPAGMSLIMWKHMGITREEVDEIAEIFAADIREKNATYPGYKKVNDELRRIRGS